MNDRTKVFNCDCMAGMKDFPDKYFELAIVDPPYGIGISNKTYSYKPSLKWASPISKIQYSKDWDNEKPDDDYFDELFRVSKNQIIWGANHFGNMPSSSCWIVWDKLNGESDQADVELAFTSFKTAARKFTYLWDGFKKEIPEKKEHPTQKPVKLYKWLLKNYAKEGDKILDSHMGSQSSRIAAFDMGFEYVGYELDESYFKAGCKRFEQHKSQLKLFV